VDGSGPDLLTDSGQFTILTVRMGSECPARAGHLPGNGVCEGAKTTEGRLGSVASGVRHCAAMPAAPRAQPIPSGRTRQRRSITSQGTICKSMTLGADRLTPQAI
jgi:hypothetical protein